MVIKKVGKSVILLLSLIFVIALSGCSKDNEESYHDASWVSSGHKAVTSDTLSECKTCHGSDLFGGTSGVDCYKCHFGPDGRYKVSEIVEIVGYTPADGNKGDSGESVTTSPLPNVPLNTYVYLKVKDADENTVISWTLTTAPAGSSSALTAEGTDTVRMMPDAKGFYVVDVSVTNGDTTQTDSIVLYGNKWAGVDKCKTCHQTTYTSWLTTDHSDANDRKLEGYYDGGYYGESCQGCHTVGYNTADYAVNGGYDDVAKEADFTLANLLLLDSFDLFETTYPTVKALSNIQCENCHGPGEDHKGVSSLSEDVCGICHDAPTHHIKTYQWDSSGHGDHDSTAFTYPVGENRESCARCHTGGGFVDFVNGVAEEDRRTEHQPITCAVCHDPHTGGNSHQIRTTNNVTLANDEELHTGGAGKLCMNCHQSRRDVNTYVLNYSNHFGPHYSPAADMYAGTGGFEFGETISTSPHYEIVNDSCVHCHMATPDDEDLYDADNHAFLAGEHTFKMEYGDIENLVPCDDCHSGITTFNMTAAADYDGDGTIEGVRDEVQGLMDALALKLPPLDDKTVTVAEDYTADQLKAAYNYLFVYYDGSLGIHNFGYAVDLLQTSYRNLTGSDVPGATLYTGE